MANVEAGSFTESTLGRTRRKVFRLGIASSYGLGAAGVEEAIERGVNYVYWGSARRGDFGEGVKSAIRRFGRERVILVVQSYARMGLAIGPSLRCAMSRLGVEHVDVLLLGWWNDRPPARIVDAAVRLRERGLVRHLALSTHERPLIPRIARDAFDIFHVRYNAAHRGAETEVFPALPAERAERPGIVAFTATRWGTLLEPPANGADGPPPTAGDCYRFVLSNPNVDVCMTGLADVAQLRHALEAIEKGPLSEEEMARMRAHGDAVRAGAARAGGGGGLFGRLRKVAQEVSASERGFSAPWRTPARRG